MACNSIACVLVVGPDVDHFVLELPPHTASFGRLYPTTPLLTESLLLHNKLHMKDFRIALHYELVGFECYLRLSTPQRER